MEFPKKPVTTHDRIWLEKSLSRQPWEPNFWLEYGKLIQHLASNREVLNIAISLGIVNTLQLADALSTLRTGDKTGYYEKAKSEEISGLQILQKYKAVEVTAALIVANQYGGAKTVQEIIDELEKLQQQQQATAKLLEKSLAKSVAMTQVHQAIQENEAWKLHELETVSRNKRNDEWEDGKQDRIEHGLHQTYEESQAAAELEQELEDEWHIEKPLLEITGEKRTLDLAFDIPFTDAGRVEVTILAQFINDGAEEFKIVHASQLQLTTDSERREFVDAEVSLGRDVPINTDIKIKIHHTVTGQVKEGLILFSDIKLLKPSASTEAAAD